MPYDTGLAKKDSEEEKSESESEEKEETALLDLKEALSGEDPEEMVLAFRRAMRACGGY